MPSTIRGTAAPAGFRGLPKGISRSACAGRRSGTDTAIRHVGQAAQSVGHIGVAGDVAPRDAQHFAPPPFAQHSLRVGTRCGRGGAPFVFDARCAPNRGATLRAHPSKSLGILDQRRCSKFTSRDQPGKLIFHRVRQILIGLAQCIPAARTLPPPHHGFAQNFRHRLQEFDGHDDARQLNHIPIKDTLRARLPGKDPRDIDVIEGFQRAMHSPSLPVLKWSLAFALIFATGALGFALPSFGGSLPLLILPSGVAVAAMYRWGRRMWPAMFAAGVAIDWSTHQPLVAAIGVGIGLAGGAALTVWVLERRGFDPSFSRARDVSAVHFCRGGRHGARAGVRLSRLLSCRNYR